MIVTFLGSDVYKYKIRIVCFALPSKSCCLSSLLIVNDFSNKKLKKKLCPDFKFISHFIRNTSDLKLKMLFLTYGTLLYSKDKDDSKILLLEQSEERQFAP